MSNKSKKKKKNARHKVLIIIIVVILLLIVGILGAAWIYIRSLMGKMKYVPDDRARVEFSLTDNGNRSETETTEESTKEPPTDTNGVTLPELNSSEVASIQADMVSRTSQADALPTENDGLYNLLLVGVDRRDASWEGNADTIMLITINYNTGKISVTSILRDTYVTIPEVGQKKINQAVPIGGMSMLLNTIGANFGINVDRWMEVDFNAFMGCVNALGGVPMSVSAEEAQVMNQEYIMELNALSGAEWNQDFVPEAGGDLWLNGKQALAYARIRYVGNNDIGRTERQRKILLAIVNQLKSRGLTAFDGIANQVLPYISHNIPENEIWDIIWKIPDLINYSITSESFPYEGHYSFLNINGDSFIAPDWGICLEMLQQSRQN